MTVVGRDGERAAVLGLASGALVLTGEPGAGKSTLLELAADAHRGRVLRVTGVESEANLPFAGLHQLLRPVLGKTDETGGLPARQRSALLGAIGLDDAGPPDRLLVGVALLALLSDLAGRSPVLVVADDLPWIDAESLAVLAFVARRIGDEPLAVLAATRDATGFAGLPTLALAPLDARAAGALLDAQPRPPAGTHRVRILDQAAGNPLALIELARANGGDADPLPPSDRLLRVFAADLDALPEATRDALLLVAMDDLAAAGQAEALAPAERAGLLRITGGRVRFRHPLVRSAIYHSAPLAARRRAHRELAALLAAEPDRRAWHLAATAEGPDESIAAALEDTAARARERAGYAAAATALERAAELSPGRADRARRLVTAARSAMYTGQPGWVEQLAGKAEAIADDAALAAEARLRVGQVRMLTGEHDAAVSLLLRAAAEPAFERVALASAAVAAFYSGDEEHRRTVRARAGDDAWTLAVTDPFARRAELVAALPVLVERAGGDPAVLTSLGAMAWLLDETALAVRIFDDALHRWRLTGALPTGMGCSAAWAYLDHGRWAQARLAVINASTGAAVPHLDAARAALEAAALALTGETAEARSLASTGLALVAPNRNRAVAARARWALGMAAVADGDHTSAYEQFRLMFTADGDPVHYACSFAGLAELAAAAVRTGHPDHLAEAAAIVARAPAADPSPRLRALVSRARALLEPEAAEAHFERALADPAGDQWPFERAQALLDHAEWLRRARRIADARPRLLAALETFRRLGARPWVERAEAELRAAGVEARPAAPAALTSLTPQQQHIIRLAAQGLSNREIGERLFLSPRTVGSHLYRSFPKLGVTTRAQLRDLV